MAIPSVLLLAPSEENADLICGVVRDSPPKKTPRPLRSFRRNLLWLRFVSAVLKQCAFEMRRGTHFAAKRPPGIRLFDSDAVPGFLFSALWRKCEFQLRTETHFDASKTAENSGVYSRRNRLWLLLVLPEENANLNCNLAQISPPKTI